MRKHDAGSEYSMERILVGVAIILCALIMGYNMLYKSDIEVIEFSSSVYENQSSYFDGYVAYSGNTNNIVNINTATAEELKTLNGIGGVTAQSIIDYREQTGKFTSTEQLLNVSGIGEAKYAAIKDFVII